MGAGYYINEELQNGWAEEMIDIRLSDGRSS